MLVHYDTSSKKQDYLYCLCVGCSFDNIYPKSTVNLIVLPIVCTLLVRNSRFIGFLFRHKEHTPKVIRLTLGVQFLF
jgi:hypothetical protein